MRQVRLNAEMVIVIVLVMVISRVIVTVIKKLAMILVTPCFGQIVEIRTAALRVSSRLVCK